MNAHILTAVLAGLAMIGPFAIDTYLPSFPAIATHFAIEPALVQQTLSVFLFAFSVMNLFYGTLSDSFGRRPVILVALAIFTASSIGAAMAPSFTWLLIFRGLQGASSGAGMVVGQAIVRDRLSGAAAQRMVANIMMVFGIAPAAAPVIGGFLHVTFGWRSIFVFMAMITAILLLACVYALPESLDRKLRQPFHLATIGGNYGKAIRHPQFLLRALAIGLAFSGFGLYIASAANFLIHVLHLPETAFAWLFVPMIAGMVAGSAIGGKLAHRIETPILIRRGYMVMAIGVLLNLAYTRFFTAAVPWAVLPIMLYSFGMALALPGMTMMTQGIFPKTRGMAASLQNFIQMLIFAIVSGFVAPMLFESAFKLAEGMAVGMIASAALWKLASVRKGSSTQLSH
jgi:DHA1 family bicyclomycin/chloramphenicol resistance-like MFS transporter